MEGSDADSDLEFQEVLHPGSLVASITVPRSVPTTLMTTSSLTGLTQPHASQHSESGESQQVLNSDIGTGVISTDDLIEDTKFYQDAASGYQDAYETLRIQQKELQHTYTQQAQLVEEASVALRAAEAESSLKRQELVSLQQQWEADIQHAIYCIRVSAPAEFCEKQPAAEGSGVSTLYPEVAGTGAIARTIAGRSSNFTFCGCVLHQVRFV